MKILKARLQGTNEYVDSKIDDEDYEWAKNYKWVIDNRKRQGYVFRRVGRNKILILHKIINKTPDGCHTDHINRDKLDNRKENLRTVTSAVNSRNRKMSSKNTSGFKGVSYYKAYSKWVVCIKYDNKNHTLGYFDTAVEAAKAYDDRAKSVDSAFTTNKKLHLI